MSARRTLTLTIAAALTTAASAALWADPGGKDKAHQTGALRVCPRIGVIF